MLVSCLARASSLPSNYWIVHACFPDVSMPAHFTDVVYVTVVAKNFNSKKYAASWIKFAPSRLHCWHYSQAALRTPNKFSVERYLILVCMAIL